MSWARVDFSLVRYSPIENTHFFFDQNHPSSIQFLLSGRWESWDVSYVGHKARDPVIRQIAKGAEARLVNDPHSGYRQWPSGRLIGIPATVSSDHAAPQPTQDHQAQTPRTDLVDAVISPSPSLDSEQHAHPSASTSPQHAGPSALESRYTSPYSQLQPTSYPTPASDTNPATTQTALSSIPLTPTIAQQQPYPPQGLPPISALTSNVVLSRRRETKILLSIDGDGIRGLSALLLIESLVNAICAKIGQRLDPHQIFDLTGGSSLGGVIALLLCRLQMQAPRAREAYKKISRQVFLNKRDLYRSQDPHMPVLDRSGAALENEINQVIQNELGTLDQQLFDDREDSGAVFVVSTHIEIGSNKAALIRSYPTRRTTGAELCANISIAQAMKATITAPKYMHQPGCNNRLIMEPGLVDHGTAKNNPIRDILYEYRKLYRSTNDMTILVSIGTGLGLNRKHEIPEMANAIQARNAEASTCQEKFKTEHHALLERGWIKYFRFNVPGLENVPLEEWCHEDAIKHKTLAYLAHPDVAHTFYACVDAIAKLLLRPSAGE